MAYSPFEDVVLPGIVVAAARKASVPVAAAARTASVPAAAAVVVARKAFVPVAAAAYFAVVEASILEVVYSLPGGSALSPVLEQRPILGSADR